MCYNHVLLINFISFIMLSESLLSKIHKLVGRIKEVEELLSQPDCASDRKRFESLTKEHAELLPLIESWRALEQIQESLSTTKECLSDPELKEMAQLEIKELNEQLEQTQQNLKLLLVPSDPNDDKNIFLEIRAGTGGQEAALFVSDLLRMYTRYAESEQFQFTIVSANESELGGYKEVIVSIKGEKVFSKLKFESGGHRVQRVPVTESQGRIHTSACTVAVMPESEEIDTITLNPADLRVDTYRASGAGGQHVNKTDSAIRLTHLPSGVVVECQEDRSQHKNRAKAMSLLKSKLLQMEKEKQESTIKSTRLSLIGSGDRSERIRTYNFPQGRITDHRINLTLYKLEQVLEGQLKEVIEPLLQEYQAELLLELESHGR